MAFLTAQKDNIYIEMVTNEKSVAFLQEKN